MRFHWQNLNIKPYGKEGCPARHFRFWLGNLKAEWLFWSNRFSLSLDIGGDEDAWCIGICLVVFSLYVGWKGGNRRKGREISLQWIDGALSITPYGRRFEWNSRDPWWVRGITIHPWDILLGKKKHWTEELETKDAFVPMPEGSYPAKVRMEYACWKRPRWFGRAIMRGNVDVPCGIPVMGKGESEWDCGEDATYSMSCPAESIEDAVSKMVRSTLKRRRQYGTPSRIKPLLSAELGLVQGA